MRRVIPWVACIWVCGCAGSEGGSGAAAASLGSGAETTSSSDPTNPGSDATMSTTMADTTDSATSLGPTEGGEGTAPGTGADTTAGPLGDCPDDLDACTVWILPAGDTEWAALALDADSPLAPTEPVRAAFVIETTNEGYVVTDSQVHVVDLISRNWERVEIRSNLFPEAVGETVLSAYAVPASHVGDPDTGELYILTPTVAYVYTIDVASSTFTFNLSAPDYSANWTEGTSPTPTEIRGTWIDVANAEGWFDVNLEELCPKTPQAVGVESGPYNAHITSDAVHLHDVGYCFDFPPPRIPSSFLPLTYPGAPSANIIGGTLYSEVAGFWVFAESP